MTETSRVTLAFVDTHPDSAAAEIAHVDPAAAAAFLDDMPTDTAARLLAEAPPWYGARVAAELKPDRAASLLRAMAVSDATPILRLLPDKNLDRVLEEMPRRSAATFRNSLNFPSWSVGAWMDRKVLNLGDNETVADAIAAFRRQKVETGTYCHVVDDEGVLVGVIDLARLMRASDSTRLADLADREVTPIYGRSRLASVASLADWDRHDVLPVLGRKGNPVGRLHRAVLRLALDTSQGETLAPEPSLLLNIADAYARAVPALLTTFLAAPAGEKPKV